MGAGRACGAGWGGVGGGRRRWGWAWWVRVVLLVVVVVVVGLMGVAGSRCGCCGGWIRGWTGKEERC